MKERYFEKLYKDWKKELKFNKQMIKWLLMKDKKICINLPRKCGQTYAKNLFKKYFEGKF